MLKGMVFYHLQEICQTNIAKRLIDTENKTRLYAAKTAS